MTGINNRVPTRVGELAVADSGPGEGGTPVVLWPSLFSDHRLYRYVTALLGPQWRTVCVDGPGFGRSDAPGGDVHPHRYAGAVVDLLDELGIETAVVAGCSWGGQVAAHTGVQFPQRTAAVLMMNTPLASSQGGHRFLVLGTRMLGSTAFWGKGVARSMVAPPIKKTHPERLEEFVAAFGSFDRAAAADTVRTVLARSPGLAAVLPQLRVPTTLMMGAQDALNPPDTALPLARLAPGATIEVVQSCGHLAPLEAPEVVVEALNSLARKF
ncbi:MAG: alpha/beta fold hydrolase [Mycobacterium sp.]|nr:alpha/beta fold hydrolase [Mycobacterium sp.]